MKKSFDYIQQILIDFENGRYWNGALKIVIPTLLFLLVLALATFGLNIIFPYLEIVFPYIIFGGIFYILLKPQKKVIPAMPETVVNEITADSLSVYQSIQFYVYKLLKKAENELQIKSITNLEDITDPLNYLIECGDTPIFRYIVSKSNHSLCDEQLVSRMLNRMMFSELSKYNNDFKTNPYLILVDDIPYSKYHLANVTDNGSQLVLDYVLLTETYIKTHRDQFTSKSINKNDDIF